MLAHRRCAVCAAAPAAPGAGRSKWRSSERYDDETQLGRPQAEGWDRARGASAAPGDFSHSRSATRAPDPRNPYDYQGRKDDYVSSGQPRLPPPGPYGAQTRGSRRSEQEQAARKAARLVDKAAESVRNNQVSPRTPADKAQVLGSSLAPTRASERGAITSRLRRVLHGLLHHPVHPLDL